MRESKINQQTIDNVLDCIHKKERIISSELIQRNNKRPKEAHIMVTIVSYADLQRILSTLDQQGLRISFISLSHCLLLRIFQPFDFSI
jgi:hypothetical protein